MKKQPIRDKELDKHYLYTFTIKPKLDILNENAFKIWIWGKFLTFFRHDKEQCVWRKEMEYARRNLSTVILPPYSYSKEFTFDKLTQSAYLIEHNINTTSQKDTININWKTYIEA